MVTEALPVPGINIGNPLVSIIVPTYNPTKLEITRALTSCVAQTYDNLEVIVIDDGSDIDAARSIDEAVSIDSRFRAVHIPNGGVSHARNVGLDAAEGEYIAFLDSDDELATDFVAEALDIIRINQADVVLGNVSNRFSDGDVLRHPEMANDELVLSGQEVHDLEDYFVAFYRRRDSVVPRNLRRGPVAKLYARDVIGDIRFDENVSYGEDCLFVADVLTRSDRAVVADRLWYVYYQNEGSLVHSLEVNDAMVVHCEAVVDHCTRSGYFGDAVRASVVYYVLSCINETVMVNDGITNHQALRSILASNVIRSSFDCVNTKVYEMGKLAPLRVFLAQRGLTRLLVWTYRIMGTQRMARKLIPRSRARLSS